MSVDQSEAEEKKQPKKHRRIICLRPMGFGEMLNFIIKLVWVKKELLKKQKKSF